MKTLRLGVVAVVSLWAFSAGAGEIRRTGLLPMGPEHYERLERTAAKAEPARPNELAVQRLNAERAARGQKPLSKSDALSSDDDALMGGTLQNPALPSVVDNSSLDAFPPIGNQANQGSCAAWAVGYYQATFQTALLRGLNAKTNDAHRVSPAFVYNHTGLFQLNTVSGEIDDFGTAFPDPLVFLLQHGALNIREMPYDASATPEFPWVIDAQDWRAAMPNRISSYSQIGRFDIDQFKTHLANGNVITLGMFWYAALFADVGDDPGTSEDNAYVGQDIITHLDSDTGGGHAVTIVGYNDHIWVDLNQNGLVDTGEKGAFKIANSWGAAWGNNGFVWAAYDSFKQTSSFFPSGRQPLINAWGGPFILNAREEYTPTMWAEFTVSHDSRDEMEFELGISDRNESSYTLSWQPGIMFDQSAWVPIGYPASANTGSFAFDLTDLWEEYNRPAKIWLKAEDTFPSNPMFLSEFRVKDSAGGDLLALSSSYEPSNRVIDNRSGTVYVNMIDNAPVAVADTYYTGKSELLVVPAPGVLENDIELDGDTIEAMKRSDPNPSKGTLTWSISNDGSFTYMPAVDEEYVVSFTYRAQDKHGDYLGLHSDAVSVTIIVGNIAPTVQITQPAARRDYAANYPITFRCVTDDLNPDDTITVEWTWDNAGVPVVMGAGLEITYADLPETGTHPSNSIPVVVSATAFDGEKYSTPATIQIDVLSDTSGDSIPDWWAIMYGLDPEADNSGLDAPAFDGTYLDAYLAGASPIVSKFGSKGCSAGPVAGSKGSMVLALLIVAALRRLSRLRTPPIR